MSTVEGLKKLLEEINNGMGKLIAEMEEKGIKESTFDANSPDEYEKLEPLTWIGREIIAAQLQDLASLVIGPKNFINAFSTNSLVEASTLNILNYFDFWHAVPEGDEGVTYDEIAAKVNLPVDVVRRVLENGIANRIFDKVDHTAVEARIKHNSHSAVLLHNENLAGDVFCMLDTYGPAVTVLARALDKWSRGKDSIELELGKLPFNYAYSGGLLGKYDSVYDLVEEEGEGDKKGWRQGEMVKAMRFLKSQLDFKETMLFSLTNWNEPANAHVVDLGGSAGYDDFTLAQEYPNLKITVQDLPKCGPDFAKAVPEELKDRVTFQAHSFLEPQPTQADIFVFKYIMIDWNDVMAERIVRSLIPALRPGNKVVVLELASIKFPPGVPMPRAMSRSMTAGDMRMMSLFGQSERSPEQIVKLFTDVDERFEVVKLDLESAPRMLLLEMVWRG